MPAQIVGIFDALTAELVQRIPALVCRLGAQHAHTHDAAPRIVWVPSEDAYQANTQPGNRKTTDLASVLTKQLGFRIFIWGKGDEQANAEEQAKADYTATEELIRLFIAMCDRCIGPSFNVNSGAWDEAGEAAEVGLLYTLLITVDVPCTLSIEDQRLVQKKITDYPIASKVVE